MKYTPSITDENVTTRSYSQAIVHACQSMNSPQDEIDKNVWIIDKLGLEPFALTCSNRDGVAIEYNALCHRSNLENMIGENFECKSILPEKRKYDSDIIDTIVCPNLAPLIHRSPYRNMLMKLHHFNLNDDVAVLLNKDWMHVPQIKFACAQVLAGAILLNTISAEAILLNTIEVYGRTKNIDIHREISTPADSTLPPSSSLYPNVWSCVKSTRDRRKLIIGTQSCSALVTPSLRLDCERDPDVGPSSFSFVTSPQTTKIYIDNVSWKKAQKLALDKDIRSLESFYLIGQARQLRSHFHQPSTYYLCRASSQLALTRPCQPCTIFTYCDFEGVKKTSDHDNPCMIASRIFQTIGYAVMDSPETASLSKQFIRLCKNQCIAGNMRHSLDDFLQLFDDDSSTITILYNISLNQILKRMAEIMSSNISRANKEVATNIQKCVRNSNQ
ncbi:hypothetical protein G6F35_001078 [Rhizopus arrhizus]|nr:hypothetical protein G6F35_001078 [Rhizopus arrhizus]